MTNSFSMPLTEVTMAHGMGILSGLSHMDINSPDRALLFKTWKKLRKASFLRMYLCVLIGQGRVLRAGCVREHEEVGSGGVRASVNWWTGSGRVTLRLEIFSDF